MKGKLFQNINQKFGKLIGYGILALIFIMAISIARNIGRFLNIRKQVEKEEAKIEKLKRENEELQKRISETQGIEFIEKEIRNKLGLVKEGETVVVLPDEETLKKLAPKIEEEEEVLPDPNWKRWLKLFL